MSFVVTLFIVVATLMVDVVSCHVIHSRCHANGGCRSFVTLSIVVATLMVDVVRCHVIHSRCHANGGCRSLSRYS